MSLRWCWVFFTGVLLTGPASAEPGKAVGVEVARAPKDTRALIVAALNSVDGKASGILNDKLADKIRETSRRNDVPVEGSIITLHRFKQPGCARLELAAVQRGVGALKSDGKLDDFGIKMRMNICRNGQPPDESIDLGVLAKTYGGKPKP